MTEKHLKHYENNEGYAPRAYELQLLLIIFSINWNKPRYPHLQTPHPKKPNDKLSSQIN